MVSVLEIHRFQIAAVIKDAVKMDPSKSLVPGAHDAAPPVPQGRLKPSEAEVLPENGSVLAKKSPQAQRLGAE